MATLNLTEAITLPDDGFAGALAARVWLPEVNGPSVVAVREDGVFDISAAFATMRDLCESPSPAEALRAAEGPRIGALKDILGHTPRDSRASGAPRLLAPIDLQAIKAAGVTFAQSLLERVIEERARGSREGAAKAREEIVRVLGDDLSALKPGSSAAMRLKDALVKAGAWSQYLEVGIGPDAEVFTKSQIAKRQPEGLGFDLEYVALLGLHPVAEGKRSGAEEMDVNVARAAEQAVLEMMRLEIGDRMGHVLLAGQERLLPDHFLRAPDARHAVDVGRQIADQQFRTETCWPEL